MNKANFCGKIFTMAMKSAEMQAGKAAADDIVCAHFDSA